MERRLAGQVVEAAAGIHQKSPGVLVHEPPVAGLESPPEQQVAGAIADQERSAGGVDTQVRRDPALVLVLDGEDPYLGARNPLPLLARHRGTVDRDIADLFESLAG